jgi:hypothetical protein
MSSASASKASKIKNASSSGRKATGSRQTPKHPPPRVQAPSHVGLSVGATRFLTLVRHKLSARVMDVPLATEMLQLQHYEKGVGHSPFDKDAATTMEGYFKTLRHHRKAGEPMSEELISVACETLSSFATNLGGGQVPPPRTARADFAHDGRVKVRDHVLEAIKKHGSLQSLDVARDLRTKWRFNPSEARAAIAEGTSEGQGVGSPQPHPPGAAPAARFTRAGVEGTKASVLEEFQRVWAEGLSCHARSVFFPCTCSLSNHHRS